MSSSSLPTAAPIRENAFWHGLVASVTSQLATAGADTSHNTSTSIPAEALCATIDHTLLAPEAGAEQFASLCAEAKEFRFATVCVRPEWVATCVGHLQNSPVRVASVIGFHEGTYSLEHKLREVSRSLSAGATELDVVLNYPQLKAGALPEVYDELTAIRQSTSESRPGQPATSITIKLILETSQLNHSEIITACILAAASGFDFVKTSTGFNGSGATREHVLLMAACATAAVQETTVAAMRMDNSREASRDGEGTAPVAKMLVKASGGIRSLQAAECMLKAGASRLGTSNGVAIAKQSAAAAHGHSISGAPQLADGAY